MISARITLIFSILVFFIDCYNETLLFSRRHLILNDSVDIQIIEKSISKPSLIITLGSRTRASSYLGLISYMYLNSKVDVHSRTRTQYRSLKKLLLYLGCRSTQLTRTKYGETHVLDSSDSYHSYLLKIPVT